MFPWTSPISAIQLLKITPNGVVDITGGDRPNNVPICPIFSTNNNVYVTRGRGGLLVPKSNTTPIEIVGEYGNAIVNGAGCGEAEAMDKMFLNAGISASASAAADQSTFSLYHVFDDNLYSSHQCLSTHSNSWKC